MIYKSDTNLDKILAGGASSGLIALGITFIREYFTAVESIRDTVYANVDKMTPEVIEYANELMSTISRVDLVGGGALVMVGGMLATSVYLSVDKTKD